MRSSSVKTVVATLFVVVTLTVTVPTAHAAVATKTRETVATVRDEPRGIDRVGKIVRRFIARIGRITATNWPSIPPGTPSSNQ